MDNARAVMVRAEKLENIFYADLRKHIGDKRDAKTTVRAFLFPYERIESINNIFYTWRWVYAIKIHIHQFSFQFFFASFVVHSTSSWRSYALP